MNEETVHYLKAPADGLWSWDEADCILWCDGSTVTFRQELLPLLDWQGLSALPPFEALVLSIAALRGKAPSADQLWRMRQPIQGSDELIYSKVQQELRRRIEETVAALARLRQLPRELLARPFAHRTLIEILAEASESSALDAGAILETLRDPIQEWDRLNPASRGTADHIPAVHVLHSAFAHLGSEQLALRIGTGCDRLLSPPEIDFANSIRKLLGSLAEDPELAALAKLARDIMAAIYIPRDLSELETLPLGGAADISNRGTLDRLLLSELAHEDDVLAVRVALNEALYLRREPPAQYTASSVAVLIDVGIRMWGSARLFGIAVALALGGRASGAGGCAFVADGKHLMVADLLSRDGLIRAMAALVSEPDPAEAMPAFLAESSHLANPQRALVTHADTLEEPAFRKLLIELPEPILVATVNAEGEFMLRWSDALDARPLCHARLDLLELSREPVHRKEKRSAVRQPAIYSAAPFPLLLPMKGNVSYAIPLPGDQFAVLTTSHRLYLTYGTQIGARLVVHEPVPGRAVVMEYVSSIDKIVLLTSAWRDGSIPLYLFDLEARDVRRLRVHVSCPPAAAWIEREFLFLYCRPRIDVVRIDSGELAQSINVDGAMEWSRGRFFEKTISGKSSGKLMTEWHVLVNQGLTWGFEPLIPSPNDVIEVFDRRSEEGPWVVREAGGVQSLAQYREKVPPALVSTGVKAVSRDGERVERSDSSVVDLTAQNVLSRILEPIPKVAAFAMRPRWSSIGVNAEGQLVLSSLRNYIFVLDRTSTGLLLKRVTGADAVGMMRGFVPEHHSELKVAEWREGVRAILDVDGLLHLQCDAPDFLEMTIGVCEGAVPVWLANGATAGPQRFTGMQTSLAAADHIRNLDRFVRQVIVAVRNKE